MNEILLQQIKELKLSGNSREAIKEALSISDTTLSKYSRYIYNFLLTPEEAETIKTLDEERRKLAIKHSKNIDTDDKNSYSYFKRRNSELNAVVRDLSSQLQTPSESILADLKPWEAGQLCELFALYKLRRHGLEAFRPDTISKALDILVQSPSGDSFYRCEVKGASKGTTVKLARTNYNSKIKDIVSSKYTQDDKIDFFICVLLEYEQVFIVPFEDTVDFGKTFCFTPISKFFKYLNRFDLFK